jgi:Arc/MetJ-type ribon-helix-helix transcriptional regulator
MQPFSLITSNLSAKMKRIDWPGFPEATNMSTSTLSIPPELGTRVQAFVDAGIYASGADVVRAALDALELQRTDIEAIQGGFNDVQEGRSRPFDEFIADFEHRKGIE